MKKRSVLISLFVSMVIFGCNTTDFYVVKSSHYPSDYLEYSEGKKALLAYYSDDQKDVEAFGTHYEILTGDIATTFQGTMVIAKLGTKNNGRYDISVESVKSSDKYMEVTILNTTLGKGCITTMAVTNPYTIVSIPNSHQEVKFIENNVTTSCQ